MISIPTVLVLGAGASTHLGFPLGIGLVDQIVEPILHDKGNIRLADSSWRDAEVVRFLRRLQMSMHWSIDSFLATCDASEQEIGKFLIAKKICEHEVNLHRQAPSNWGWYRHLLDSAFNADSGDYSGNQLEVITFNYDRSLEFFLLGVLRARYPSESLALLTERSKTLRIHHVYGSLGETPVPVDIKKFREDDFLRMSRSIRTIHESESSKPGNAWGADEMREKFEAASRIVFLGFGFHPENLRRLGFCSDQPISLAGKEVLAATNTAARNLAVKTMMNRVAEVGLREPEMKWLSWSCEALFQRELRLT